MPTAPDPQPIVTPPAPPYFALNDLGNGQVEFVVRVTSGDRYRETRWNEVETPEIKRLFDEFTRAQQELGQ